MEEDAQAYSKLNQPQIDAGNNFVRDLCLSQGDKVLDMGCGTGDVSKHISETVGSGGQVIGIDPDAARIKIAQEKFKEVSNLQFHVGSSAIGFPHDNEPYYNAHISTSAFHWINDDEKKIYLKKAYQCLKPGGKLGILASLRADIDRDDLNESINYYPLSQEGYQKLFQNVGLFSNVDVKTITYPVRCKSLGEFKRWAKASTHVNMDDFDQAYVKEKLNQFVTILDDGSVDSKSPAVAITAIKT